jgi:hypothetical protein
VADERREKTWLIRREVRRFEYAQVRATSKTAAYKQANDDEHDRTFAHRHGVLRPSTNWTVEGEAGG